MTNAALAAVSTVRKSRSKSTQKTVIDVRATSATATKRMLVAGLNPKGTTVLSDFGRVLRDEPHKLIYKEKLYMKRDKVAVAEVMRWLRDRYIAASGHSRHHAFYEVRRYKAGDGVNYVDWVLLERLTDDERMMFVLEFGDVTDQRITRDGKMRRPRLNKEQKKTLDAMVNQYYLDVAEQRANETKILAARRSAEAQGLVWNASMIQP